MGARILLTVENVGLMRVLDDFRIGEKSVERIEVLWYDVVIKKTF